MTGTADLTAVGEASRRQLRWAGCPAVALWLSVG
jgi:hypothetical protein